MPRKKGNTKYTEGTSLTKQAREAVREQQREEPEPVELSGVRSFADTKRQMLAEPEAARFEATQVGLPADNEADFPTIGAAAEGSIIGGKATNAMPYGKPVARFYKLYAVPFTKHIILFQFPNRGPNQPYNEANHQKPLKLRIKPKCGLVEVDIPINVHTNFDKEKGILYGEAMRRSQVLQEGGSYGPAGGLGIGGTSRPVKGDNYASGNDELPMEALLENFEDANNKGHVMNKITLAGQIIPFKDGDPLYFIGAFRGDEGHLSKVSAIVQMRPKLSHLDALADQEKSSTRAQRDADHVQPESEARAVNMTVKSSDGEELDMSATAKTLRAMQEEPWQRLSWVDEEDARSYKVFNGTMFHPDTANAPELISTMTNEQYLDAISAPRIDPTSLGRKVMMTKPTEDRETSTDEDSDEEEEDESEEDEGGEDEVAHSGDEDAGGVGAVVEAEP